MYFANSTQGIKKGLESLDFHPEIRDLNSFQDDYGMKPTEDEEEDSEAGDEGDEEEDDDDHEE
jgi:hypothetical protein